MPLRFISEALGAEVSFDNATRTAIVNTGSGCTLPGGQKHEGKITPGGETWGLCGSPHIVAGDFVIEGGDSPILTIAAGALVQFEKGASLIVGRNAPGGLLVEGTATAPVTLTSAAAGAQPGAWEGIKFYEQTLRDNATIQHARIEYAGGSSAYSGAIYVEAQDQLVEILLKNAEITKSQYAGINLYDQARLAAGSGDLKITGTKVVNGNGGFPFVTSSFGTHNLPRGTYADNDVNAVLITEHATNGVIGTSTTWRNIGIPYAANLTVTVEGNNSPTLTIEPGVISLWAQGTGLRVGNAGPGHLVADATARPEGGGEWTVGKADLDAGVKVADASALEPGCALCAQNKAIVFGAWNASPERGAWAGISLQDQAGDKNLLKGVVIAYGGADGNYTGGLYGEAGGETTVKFSLINSLITGAARSGMQFWGSVQIKNDSTGNYFENNGWPITLAPDHIGYLPAGQTFTGNDQQTIVVQEQGVGQNVSKTATWRNHGIPYSIQTSMYLTGTGGPKVTIEPGTTLNFNKDCQINIGGGEGTGSLIAVGEAGKPVKFTSDLGRAGAWGGLKYWDNAGGGNRLENVVIEYAQYGVELSDDLGAFIKNSTIRSSSETGIWRGYELDGTSFTTGLGNQFEGNAVDQNEE